MDKVRKLDADPSWKAPFRRALIRALVKHGSPVDPTPRTYGWIARDWPAIGEAVTREGIDYDKTTYDDSEWWEFAGSFAEPHEGDRRGIDAVIVTLAGNSFRYRFSGTPGELIGYVLAEDE